MRKLLLLLFLIPNLATAENFTDWIYLPSGGFWSSPTIQSTMKKNKMTVNIEISCASYSKKPHLALNLYYSGYDWEEIEGTFVLTVIDKNKDTVINNYEFGRNKLFFNAANLRLVEKANEGSTDEKNITTKDIYEEMITHISKGNEILIQYFFPSKKRVDWKNLDLMGKGKSEWNVNSFQKNLMRLKGACQA